MAVSSISMLALLLLMSAVTPGLSTEGEGSLNHTATVLIIAMRQVIQALEFFGDTVQEGLRQQRQSSDALTDLHTLTAAVGDLQRLLDDKTSENERNVDKLNDLRVKFEAKSSESEQNLEKVQDLGRNLDESRRNAEKMEQLIQQLNNTLESKKKDVLECAEQTSQKIRNLVLQYSGSRDWPTLGRGLDAEMDHSSEAYGELKNMVKSSGNAQWHMGYHGYTQLVTLLLCAGMPVDLPDTYFCTLLLGAASGGQYQLAKMLMSRRADVNVMDIYGFTPIMGAAHIGSLDIVKLLVQAGADTTAKDRDGRNALYLAKKQGNTAVQQYLEQLSA